MKDNGDVVDTNSSGESIEESLKSSNGGLGGYRASPSPSSPVSPTYPPLEFSCEGNDYPLIPPGDYEVAFVRAVKKQQWGGHKAFLWFQIITAGEWHGTQLFLPFNLKGEGKISTRSKYHQNWVVAAGKKPDRQEKKRMSTRVFEGKVFLARVATVTKDQKNIPLHPESRYSKIEGLLKRLTD
ncbi:MAG: hypothetical protein KC643_26640 [Nitrospira sp.]|nr:hypothetical protein [Nitrospira sp.]MDR4487321.1 hypothetical protein [Nitrospirales bacterium]